jgi:phosphotransferase system  glucose/maltose/N-acetylglucosamine-specific IIC component
MFSLLFKLLYACDLFVEAAIVMRIVLSILNANLSNTFVSWIYDISSLFITPFEGIVSNSIKIDSFTFELTPIVALVFYIILAFVLSELIKAFSHRNLD